MLEMFCFINVVGFCNRPIEMAGNFDLKKYPEGCYCGKFNHLKICVQEDGRYKIKGSIWKFYHGNNCGSFTISEFKQAIDELDSLSFGTFSKSDLVGFEFGVNIEVIQNPSYYLKFITATIINSRVKEFFPFFRRETMWKIETQKYYVNYKIYSKSFHLNLKDKNILRLEMKVNNVKSGLKTSLIVNDLINQSIYGPWVTQYKSFIDGLVLKPSFNNSDLINISGKEVYKRLLISNAEFHDIRNTLRQVIRKKKTLEAEFTSLKKCLALCNYNEELKGEIVQKVGFALDNATYFQ